MAFCNSCGAQIQWVETEAGKSMPIDAEPVANGNLIKSHSVDRTYRGRRRSVTVVAYIGPAEETAKERFVSHFATCPHRDHHRKKPT